MRYYRYVCVITALMIVILSVFSYASVAQAKGSELPIVTLVIDPLGSFEVGQPVTIVARFATPSGETLGAFDNEVVQLYVNGVRERRKRTDAAGTVRFSLGRELPLGVYTIKVVYGGSRSLPPSSASTELVITRAVIEVHTVPPLPNIKFALGEQTFSSDKDGIARIEIEKAGMYHLELLPLEAMDSNMKIEFSRWGDDTFVPYRDIEVPLAKPLAVGFEVSNRVSNTFVDLADRPVDSTRITSVTIKGSNGTTFTFEDHQPHWLLVGRVVRLNNGLEQSKILYSIISVDVDGSNVVSQAQQRYYVKPNDVWPVKLLLYSARIIARDALFRFPIGSGIQMEYPDGNIQTFSFNSTSEHVSESLARGIYEVTVTGVRGFAPPTPIALSRDQDVVLLVISYLDVGVALALALSFVFGLLFLGRPKLLTELASIPNRIISRKWITLPAGFSQGVTKLNTLRSRLVPKALKIQTEKKIPQLFSRLNFLGNILVPKTWEAQPETRHDRLVPYNTEQNEEQGDGVSRQLSKTETFDASISPQMLDDKSIPFSEGTSDLYDIPLGEVSEAAQKITALPADGQNDESSQDASETEALDLTSKFQIRSAEQLNLTEPPQVMPNPLNDGKGNTIQAENTHSCRECGSSQFVKNGTNHQGDQQYRCKTCGTNNVFKSKRSRKGRRNRSVEKR